MIDHSENGQSGYFTSFHHDDVPVVIAIICLMFTLYAHLTRHPTMQEAGFSVWEIPATKPGPEFVAASAPEEEKAGKSRRPLVLSASTVAGKPLIIEQFIPFSEPIDINRADEKILMVLEGIGAKTARAIIAYRNEIGGFTHVSQLMRVPGIGSSTYLRLSPLLTVGQGFEGHE